MSGFHPIADIVRTPINVRKVPLADIMLFEENTPPTEAAHKMK
jgi:hypothetical protein